MILFELYHFHAEEVRQTWVTLSLLVLNIVMSDNAQKTS